MISLGLSRSHLQVIYALYTYNKSSRRRNSNAALRVRYQYNENVTTLDAILPAVAAYGGFYCLAFPVCLYTFIFLLNNPEIVPGSSVDWQKDTVIHVSLYTIRLS